MLGPIVLESVLVLWWDGIGLPSAAHPKSSAGGLALGISFEEAVYCSPCVVGEGELP